MPNEEPEISYIEMCSDSNHNYLHLLEKNINVYEEFQNMSSDDCCL